MQSGKESTIGTMVCQDANQARLEWRTDGGLTMKISGLKIIVLILLTGFRVTAQISPGEMTTAHQNLEGMDNCISCHSVGKSLSNDKCLSCHAEINGLLKSGNGYHATIKERPCNECHKEHHGRTFQIIRFEENGFDHALTGWRLEEKHASIACRQCHAAKNIKDAAVLRFTGDRLSKTFLGLSTRCNACHDDRHRGQFSNRECASCHTVRGWKPAHRFEHSSTRYPLTGKHQRVGCTQCHTAKMNDGITIRFTGMEFSTCQSCHADPHKKKFSQPCSTCHTTDDFHRTARGQFDHQQTNFPLRGKHLTLSCDRCHQNNPKAINISGEKGFHITRYSECSACHKDAHAGQISSVNGVIRCEQCHTEEGFNIVLYTVKQHNTSRFMLQGSHLAVPCGACHHAGAVQASCTRQFRWDNPHTCTSCHLDTHQEQFGLTNGAGCTTCHTTQSWQQVNFSHDTTDFPLQGKHAVTPCKACHTPSADPSVPVRYVGVSTVCSDCHKDEHNGQFATATDTSVLCTPCHTPISWSALRFDHSKQSRFPLTGKHVNIACEKCHTKEMVQHRLVTRYKPLEVTCAGCHTGKQ